jgi:hypothetical protein
MLRNNVPELPKYGIKMTISLHYLNYIGEIVLSRNFLHAACGYWDRAKKLRAVYTGKCLRKGHCRRVLLYMYMLAACFSFLSLFPFMQQM